MGRFSKYSVLQFAGTLATFALGACLVAFCAGYVPAVEESVVAELTAAQVAEVVDEEVAVAEDAAEEPVVEILEVEEAEDEAVEVPVEEAASSLESEAVKSKKSAKAVAEEAAAEVEEEAEPVVAMATIAVTITVDASRAGGEWQATMAAMELTLEEGATVYDALVATGLALGGSSSYISSIGGLAEFMCGSGSGWMYAVDGVFPNKSCGKYVLTGGESIQWIYTCALGKDIEL